MGTGVPAQLSARRFYTRSVPGIWWVAGPLIGLLVVCASLGGIVAAYYLEGVDGRQPTRYYTGAEADVVVPITATRVNLWAEFATTEGEAAATIELNNYLGLASYFTGTRADGSPWTFQLSDDLRSYVRTEAGRIIVGVPVGWSTDRGVRASMSEVVPVGYALGFSDESQIDLMPLLLILPMLAGVALFLRTMTPDRNAFESSIETDRRARRDEERIAKDGASGQMRRRMDAQARANYQNDLAKWRRDNQWYLRRDTVVGGQPPVDPDAAAKGTGWYVVVMTVVLFAGPLWALVIGVGTGVRALSSQVVEDSALAVLLPLMGDTPWRVFVMATTAMLVLSLIPAVGVMLAWRVQVPRLRATALIVTGVMLVLMLIFVIIGTALPVDRAIR